MKKMRLFEVLVLFGLLMTVVFSCELFTEGYDSTIIIDSGDENNNQDDTTNSEDTINLDEEDTTNSENTSSETTSTLFSISGEEYTFTHGLVSEYGAYDGAGIGTDTHYFLTFELADAEFVEDGYTYSALDSSVSMTITMFASGTTGFKEGTYDYIYYNDVEDYYSLLDRDFFEEGTGIYMGDYWNTERSWGVKSGTIDVTYNGGNNFTLDLDLTIAEFDFYEQFIDGTGEEISFTFTGNFLYEFIDWRD